MSECIELIEKHVSDLKKAALVLLNTRFYKHGDDGHEYLYVRKDHYENVIEPAIERLLENM